jgi:hypothetical protein
MVMIAGVVLLAGCAKSGRQQEEPFVAPVLSAGTTYFAGTPLSGPTTRPTGAVSPTDASAVDVTFLALERMPAGLGEPLGPSARLIVASRLGAPVLPSASLTGRVRLLTAGSAEELRTALASAPTGRAAGLYDAVAAVPSGVTVSFELADPAPERDGVLGVAPRRRMRVYVFRPSTPAGAAPQVAVSLSEFVAPKPPADKIEDAMTAATTHPTGQPAPPPPPLGPPELTSELALVDVASPSGAGNVAVVVPAKFSGSKTQAIAALIRIAPGSVDDPVHAQALAFCTEQLKRSAAEAAGGPRLLLVGPSAASSYAGAVVAVIEQPERRRASLLYLSGRLNARLCEDVALVGDDAALAEVAKRLAKTLAGSAALPGDAELGWSLDRCAFEVLAQLSATADSNPMAPELASVISAHFGQAGRNASSLEELSRASRARQEFENRLLAENLIFLEDPSPAARVRAYDWLAARGKAPAGFDPLGPSRQRRAALEKALENLSAASTSPSQGTAGGGQP